MGHYNYSSYWFLYGCRWLCNSYGRAGIRDKRIIELMDGIGLVGLVVGLFAVSEVLENVEEPLKQVFFTTKMRFRDMFPTRDEWRRVLRVYLVVARLR